MILELGSEAFHFSTLFSFTFSLSNISGICNWWDILGFKSTRVTSKGCTRDEHRGVGGMGRPEHPGRRGQRSLLGGWVLYAQHHNSHHHWPEVDHPVCGFLKSVSSPTALFGPCLFISTSASGMGNWGKTADSYFSSLVGSGGKSAVLMRPRSKVGAPGGPVSWAAVAGLRPEPQPGRLVCTCVSAG